MSGVAPSEEDREQVIGLVQNIPGVRSVASELTIGDWIREFRARRSANVVTLSGKVPSEATRDGIVRRVSEVFAADSIVDRLDVQGGPVDDTWTRVVNQGLSLLPQMTEGEVRLVNQDMSLLGRVDKPSVRDSLRKWLANLLPVGYTSSTEITVPEGLQLLSPDECKVELQGIVAKRQISFSSGSARLTPEASPILEEAVNVARRCQGLTIEVAGYTDSFGDDELNRQISDERARAVVDYLASRGISRTALVAKGYGEAKPIASNRTWTGRSMNRRIEFTIIR